MDKIKEYALITVMALSFMLITGVARAEENKVTEVINSVGNHISNEVVEIKEYQANSWADAKTQWANNKAQLAGFFKKFVKTESTQ
jgi:hypothetical protein